MKVSQNLSSNVLFHFTRSLGNLMGILTSGFKLSYVPELLPKKAPNGESLYYVVPMICFCDIPLSAIKAHLMNYGSYGLGVHKKICQVKNINPVFYIYTSRMFGSILPSEKDDFRSVIPYIKEYNGKSVKKDKDVKFYDEREWRCVDTQKMQIFQTDRNGILSICKKFNEKYEKCLEFDLDDFEYVIVDRYVDRAHILEMIDTRMKGLPKEKKNLLHTKIFVATRIKYDL
ncbi:MAG: abortive infection system antitoxin AbiGi family protein [Candidatus Paceibacterota bacterium]|jgi:hypothetical protein